MEINWLTHGLAAFIPLVVGFIWYNPKTFEPAWMKASGLTPEKMERGNMPLIFGLSLILSFLLTFIMSYLVHHEMGLQAIFRPIEQEGLGLAADSETGLMLQGLIAEYTERFSTFKHGAFHGVFTSVLFVLPIMATSAMFERKSGKYIFINWTYWCITLALMGGVLCQWA